MNKFSQPLRAGLVIVLLALTAVSAATKVRYKVSANYTFDAFGRNYVYGPWHLLAVDVAGKFEWGSLILRTNLAQRVYSSSSPVGIQFEADAYPKLNFIKKSTYAYLNVGYSPTSLFPVWRAGAEIYTGLPWHLETSLGARYLRFISSSDTLDPIKNIFIFTGSLGYYLKDNWFSIRPFITPKESGVSVSGIFLVRHYWSDDNYMYISAGIGSSPEEADYLEVSTRYSSYKVGTGLQWSVTSSILLKGGVRFEVEEYRPDLYGTRFTVSAGIQKRF